MSFLQDAARLLADGQGWAGLHGDALAVVLADVTRDGRWLVVVDGQDVADRLVNALQFLHPQPKRVLPFPMDDVRPYDGFSPGSELPAARLRALWHVDNGDPVVVVAPVQALLPRVPSRAERAAAIRTFARGDHLDRDHLVRHLQEVGYLAVGRVEDSGTYAVRGDVVDLWPMGGQPLRIDFFDDEVEDIRRLDPTIQRPGPRPTGPVTVLPAREERFSAEAKERFPSQISAHVSAQARGLQLRRRLTEDVRSGIRFAGVESYLPALMETETPMAALAHLRGIVVFPDACAHALHETERTIHERWSHQDDEDRPLVSPTERYAAATDVIAALAVMHPVREQPVPGTVDLGARPPDGFLVKASDLEPSVQKLRGLVRQGVRVALIAEDSRRAAQLVEMLATHGMKPPLVARLDAVPPSSVAVIIGPLHRGFVAIESGLAVIPAGALFGERAARRIEKAHAFFDASVTSLSELKEGDAVVHRLHGVGRYRGLVRVPVQVDLPRADGTPRQVADGITTVEQDFVQVEYRDGDRMMLPVTRLDLLSRFVQAHDGGDVKLDKLGGVTWALRKGKVRDSILALATDLLAVYARREVATRPPYRYPGEAYALFEAKFPHEETPDQAAAIANVNEDLLLDVPMDRLVCGDVGYGKTEVAMRAAMRAVESDRQVAVMCPTTVLALQHLRTFTERFADFPVKVAMLSRFTSPAEERNVIAGLRDGTVDIVIGTTRLLGRSVKFAKLGLVVVDEEHRFGVTQKDRLKKMRSEVDFLAMSATPIPRTLQMAVSGMRAMSIMATPPTDRLAVRTSVASFARGRIRDAILYELERKGQVFFVHNRVEDIEALAKQLAEWVPEARFLVAHGQMAADDLEDTLIRFMDKQADVLVSSSIIESGIDLPNVNTMIVNRADRFGLAQLYQLRGRVGRGTQRAVCLLLVPDEPELLPGERRVRGPVTNDAKRRIRTIVEHADLGAGFRIAMADLEIRGAGNLLGDNQSGNIDQIGYEAYLELLQEAIADTRGEHEATRIDPEVEVPVAAFLPDALFPDVTERLGRYRSLAGAVSETEIDAWLGALEEQFGTDLPDPARNLAGLARTKLLCRRWGVVRCAWLKVRVTLELHPRSKLPDRARALIEASPKRWALLTKDGTTTLEVRFLPDEAQRPLLFLRWLFAQFDRST